MQDFRQRRRTSTHGKHRRKSVNPSFHMVRHEMPIQLRIHNCQNSIDQSKTLVHTIHGAPHITRALIRNEFLKRRESFHLTPRRIQKHPTQHVHPLHIPNLLRIIRCARIRPRAPRQAMPAHHRRIGAATKFRQCRRGLPAIDAGFVCVVEPPRDRVEHAGDAVLRDAPSKERIALEGAEGVVLDFGVGGRRALSDEVEVDFCAEGGRVEEDEPEVDAQFGLRIHCQSCALWHWVF